MSAAVSPVFSWRVSTMRAGCCQRSRSVVSRRDEANPGSKSGATGLAIINPCGMAGPATGRAFEQPASSTIAAVSANAAIDPMVRCAHVDRISLGNLFVKIPESTPSVGAATTSAAEAQVGSGKNSLSTVLARSRPVWVRRSRSSSSTSSPRRVSSAICSANTSHGSTW